MHPAAVRERVLQRMQFDGHPDAIRFCVIAVPWVAEATIVSDHEEWVMSESREHRDIFVECFQIVLPELLHVTGAEDLGVNFQKLVSGMDSAVRLFWRVPEVQLEPVPSWRS